MLGMRSRGIFDQFERCRRQQERRMSGAGVVDRSHLREVTGFPGDGSDEQEIAGMQVVQRHPVEDD